MPSGVGGVAPTIEPRVNFCHDAPRIFSIFDLAPACLSEKSSWCKIQAKENSVGGMILKIACIKPVPLAQAFPVPAGA